MGKKNKSSSNKKSAESGQQNKGNKGEGSGIHRPSPLLRDIPMPSNISRSESDSELELLAAIGAPAELVREASTARICLVQ